MKDIEKMKAEFEEQLRLAKIGNEFEEKFCVESTVFRSCGHDMVHVKCTNHKACQLLNALQPTEEWHIDHDKNSKHIDKYRLESRRGYADRQSTLEIEFVSDGILYWMTMPIDNNPLLEPFFNGTTRPIVDTELSTYHPTNSSGLLDSGLRIPKKCFKSTQVINYYGGSQLLVDPDEIDMIINAIKNQTTDEQ